MEEMQNAWKQKIQGRQDSLPPGQGAGQAQAQRQPQKEKLAI